jgi:hypothetical protein
MGSRVALRAAILSKVESVFVKFFTSAQDRFEVYSVKYVSNAAADPIENPEFARRNGV